MLEAEGPPTMDAGVPLHRETSLDGFSFILFGSPYHAERNGWGRILLRVKVLRYRVGEI